MNHPATLLLGGVPRIAVPIARSLARQGIPVYCARLGPDQPHVRSRAIQQCFPLPDVHQAELLPMLLTLVAQYRIDYLIPCNDSSLRFIAEHYGELSEHAKPACPRPEVLWRVLDKAITLEIATRCDIPVPQEANDEAAVADLQFPVVVKPKTKLQESDFKVRYLSTPEALRDTTRSSPAFFEKYLVQEYCPGAGVGIEVLMHAGEPRMLFQHRRLREYPVSGGVSVVATAEKPEPKLTDMAVRLLRAMDWNGVAMVEFRYQPATRRAALMEVNGRYWGSLGLSAVCGVDFPFAQWALDHGQPLPPAPVPKYGTRARWTAGVLSNLAEGAPVTNSLRDLSPMTRDMLFEWADPVPALLEAGTVLAAEAKARAGKLLRSALPESLRRDLLTARRHGWRVAYHMRRRRAQRRRTMQLPSNTRSVLFVCHGNIMRSAVAEALFRHIPQGSVEVTAVSAGLFAIPGKAADPRTITAARQLFALDLSRHKATLLDRKQVDAADLIFVMDLKNEAVFLERFPDAASKLFLLGQLCPELCGTGCEIPDPYEGSAEDSLQCFRKVSVCVEALISALSRTGPAAHARG